MDYFNGILHKIIKNKLNQLASFKSKFEYLLKTDIVIRYISTKNSVNVSDWKENQRIRDFFQLHLSKKVFKVSCKEHYLKSISVFRTRIIKKRSQ